MPVGSVAVTGVAAPVGERVVALLERDRIVTDDVTAADVVVMLSSSTVQGVLDALENLTPAAVVLLSSAIVYGGWPDNPVPITEDAPIRPNPGVTEAAEYAEAERLVAVWSADHPGVPVAVLRAATVIAPGTTNWLADALTGMSTVRPARPEPARQFVHADDVASAVAFAVARRVDGVFNVAPSGAVAADVVRELCAWHLTLPVPAAVAPSAARWAWALRLSPVPPAALPLVEHAWVVASDRLQAAGWVPRYSSEEAVVAGRSPSWWRELGPGQRQRAALIGAGVLATSAVAGVGAAVARARRRVSPGGRRPRR